MVHLPVGMLVRPRLVVSTLLSQWDTEIIWPVGVMPASCWKVLAVHLSYRLHLPQPDLVGAWVMPLP